VVVGGDRQVAPRHVQKLRAGAAPARPGIRRLLGSNTADRQLDWLFHGSKLSIRDHQVDARGAEWSDHLPLITDLALA